MTGATAANSGSGGGEGVNGGVPTLTTPTLTPTTLRNIEQIFAESDPHAPPYQHENAAGFVPPIVSPTSGAFSPVSLKPNISNNHINNLSEGINTPDSGPLPLSSPSRHSSYHLLHPSSAGGDNNGPIPLLSPSRAARKQFQDEPLPLLSPSKHMNNAIQPPPLFLANLPPKAAAKLKMNGLLNRSNNGNDGRKSGDERETNGLSSQINDNSIINMKTNNKNNIASISRPQTLSIPRPVTLDLSCPRSNGGNTKISRLQTLPLNTNAFSSKPKFVLPPLAARGEPPGALSSPRQDFPPSPQTPLSILAAAGLSSPILSGFTSPGIASLTTGMAKSPTSPSISQLLSLAAASAARSQYTGSSVSPRGGGGLLSPPLMTPSFLRSPTGALPGPGNSTQNVIIKQEEDKAEDLSISRPETPLTSPTGLTSLNTPTVLAGLTTPTSMPGFVGLITPTGLSSLTTPTGFPGFTSPTGLGSLSSSTKMSNNKSMSSSSDMIGPGSNPAGGHIEFLDKFLKAAAAASPMNTPTSAMLFSPVKELNAGLLRAISPPQLQPILSSSDTTTSFNHITTTTNSNQSIIIDRATGTFTVVDLKPPPGLSITGTTAASSSYLSTLAQASVVPSLQIPAVTVSPAVSQERGVPASLKKRAESMDLDENMYSFSRSSTDTLDNKNMDEDMKKLQRRERNKLAAARCRKRRLDLTTQLEDEVSEWEKRVRSLKQHLIELEQDKKKLESLLTRHKPCKHKKQ